MLAKSKLIKIKQDGWDNLQVVLDFDETITDKESLFSVFHKEIPMSEMYFKQVQGLRDKYWKFEADKNFSSNKKKLAMCKWWEESFELLKRHNFHSSYIRQIANSSLIRVKNGLADFLFFCDEKNIPVTILSASFIGKQCIPMILERFDINFKNIQIISNDLLFDKNGFFLKVKGDIMNSANKEDFFDINKVSRRNLIIVGDRQEDVSTVKGNSSNSGTYFRLGILDDAVLKAKTANLKFFDQVSPDFCDIIEILK